MKIKAKYFLLEPKCGAWRQNGGRLGDVTEAWRPVLRGLEVILQILRLGGNFCGDHGASAPSPSSRRSWVMIGQTNSLTDKQRLQVYTFMYIDNELFLVFMSHAHNTELVDLLRMTSERLSHFSNEQVRS